MKQFSVNNRFILESYKSDRTVRPEIRGGLVSIAQKLSLVGLKLLTDAITKEHGLIPKGSTAYIKENRLHSLPWGKEVFSGSGISEPFIIVDLADIEFFSKEEKVIVPAPSVHNINTVDFRGVVTTPGGAISAPVSGASMQGRNVGELKIQPNPFVGGTFGHVEYSKGAIAASISPEDEL